MELLSLFLSLFFAAGEFLEVKSRKGATLPQPQVAIWFSMLLGVVLMLPELSECDGHGRATITARRAKESKSLAKSAGAGNL